MKVMAAEEKLVHVTLSGDINGEYIVKDEGPDGELTLVPDSDVAYPAVVPAFRGRPATSEEFQELLGDLPTDGEGSGERNRLR
jgi:hypothetical protein